MRKTIFLILIVYIFFPLLGSMAGEPEKPNYWIKLIPETVSDTYNLKVGETKTFVIQGIEQNPESKAISNIEVSHIWWQYNMDILEKVNSSKNSITLRATSAGITELKITVDIKGQQFTKTVTIEVEK